MQAALSLVPSPLPIVTLNKTSASPRRSLQSLQTPRFSPIKATVTANDNSTVDYSSIASVFPAEACETVGGDACAVEMFPEAKLQSEFQKTIPGAASETVDREYLEYNSPKTVFLSEACDDLGGEFCEPDFQRGEN